MTTEKIRKTVKEMIMVYFGYLPKSLEQEGMKCHSKNEISALVYEIENHYYRICPSVHDYLLQTVQSLNVGNMIWW